MSQRGKVLAVLIAWLFASGAQWDLLQAFAWGRMFVGYAQKMSLTAAARQTVSGEMCGVCEVVQKGKQEQSRDPVHAPAKGKAPLFEIALLPAGTRLVSPCREEIGLVPAQPDLTGCERAAPPLEPPRGRV